MYFLFLLIFLYFAVPLISTAFKGIINILVLILNKIREFFSGITRSIKDIKDNFLFKIRGYEKVEEPSYDFEKMRREIDKMK